MKDLLLVHGWGFGAGVWQPVLDELGSDLSARAVALPGYGTAAFSADRIPAGATVCAWSLGASLAMQWVQSHADRISHLVLVGATPRFTVGDTWRHAQTTELLDGFAAAVLADPPAALRRFAALLNQGDARARALTRQLAATIESACPDATTLLRGLDLLRDIDLRTQVPQIRVPTLVVHGAHDPLMPLAAGRWLAEHVADGHLEVFADAAHAPFLSDPQRFCATLRTFIDA